MTKRRLTPQEKKILSYAKDCRNGYGENDKASRKAIPRRKQQQNQNERRVMKANLKRNIDGNEDVSLARPKKGGWQKLPDTPLGQRLDLRRNRRMTSELRKEAKSRLKKLKLL